MARWERTIEINANPARVWQIMSDVSKWPEWTPSIESVDQIASNMAIGSEAVVKAKGTPKAKWRVTEWNPGQNFTWVTSVRGAKTVGEHIIQPDGEGRSKATLAIEVKGFMASLFKPMIAKTITGNLELESQGLKRRAEAA
jgi:carbon monoxide dehydrogenase subunit G